MVWEMKRRRRERIRIRIEVFVRECDRRRKEIIRKCMWEEGREIIRIRIRIRKCMWENVREEEERE